MIFAFIAVACGLALLVPPQGLEFLKEIDPLVAEAETDITSPLSEEELKTLNNLLTKLRN